MHIHLVRADDVKDAADLTALAAMLVPHDPFEESLWADPNIDTFWIMDQGIRIGIVSVQQDAAVAPTYFDEPPADPGSAYLILIGVQPTWRRLGVGAEAMKQFIAHVRGSGRQRINSNLRVGNAASKQLHRSAGFTESRIIADYYPQPLEDTLVLQLDL